MQAMPMNTAAIENAFDRVEAAARKTAVAPLQNAATGSVEAAAARTQLAANLSVTRTADAMLGTLLDIKA